MNEIVNHENEIEGNWVSGEACQGDSGAPLTCVLSEKHDEIFPVGSDYMKKERHYLFGVASWGAVCGKKTAPGVWANTWSYPKFFEWVNNVCVYCE